MISILITVGTVIDALLLLPISTVIESIINIIYYFLAASWFIGYCLVEAGGHIWSALCNVWDYIYYGTGDGLNLARYLAEELVLLIGNVLIGLGNCTLWILMLLPRAIIVIIDYIILALDQLARHIVERGTYLLKNVFQLTIGIALLLVVYMFRRYVHLLALYLLRTLINEISTKGRLALQWSANWTNQQVSWVFQKLEVSEASTNASGHRSNCVVCLERNKNIVILPCRHLCLCKECAQQLHRLESGHRCPVCRNDVHTLLPVYD
ncbi:mitochondrial ubiquitin ligase activator of nfkb 1-A [Drosophila mojavensis]|uniref:RING-type domain-containing protein n=1 Tax=Drosophila mojavensis TaxID=7230 RepID=B4KIZ8_DROMO|nr:mitochondrial ubiquitin ligase activator of nfkb 1-A [Drosophila mojavensis]EDW13511.2 uncharacterized protein Dmoj_GI18251 [Drosophila mojavensis]